MALGRGRSLCAVAAVAAGVALVCGGWEPAYASVAAPRAAGVAAGTWTFTPPSLDPHRCGSVQAQAVGTIIVSTPDAARPARRVRGHFSFSAYCSDVVYAQLTGPGFICEFGPWSGAAALGSPPGDIASAAGPCAIGRVTVRIAVDLYGAGRGSRNFGATPASGPGVIVLRPCAPTDAC